MTTEELLKFIHNAKVPASDRIQTAHQILHDRTILIPKRQEVICNWFLHTLQKNDTEFESNINAWRLLLTDINLENNEKSVKLLQMISNTLKRVTDDELVQVIFSCFEKIQVPFLSTTETLFNVMHQFLLASKEFEPKIEQRLLKMDYQSKKTFELFCTYFLDQLIDSSIKVVDTSDTAFGFSDKLISLYLLNSDRLNGYESCVELIKKDFGNINPQYPTEKSVFQSILNNPNFEKAGTFAIKFLTLYLKARVNDPRPSSKSIQFGMTMFLIDLLQFKAASDCSSKFGEFANEILNLMLEYKIYVPSNLPATLLQKTRLQDLFNTLLSEIKKRSIPLNVLVPFLDLEYRIIESSLLEIFGLIIDQNQWESLFSVTLLFKIFKTREVTKFLDLLTQFESVPVFGPLYQSKYGCHFLF